MKIKSTYIHIKYVEKTFCTFLMCQIIYLDSRVRYSSLVRSLNVKNKTNKYFGALIPRFEEFGSNEQIAMPFGCLQKYVKVTIIQCIIPISSYGQKRKRKLSVDLSSVLLARFIFSKLYRVMK